MAGIYIHIPFCKQACNYCDFHFATTLRQKDPLIDALRNELKLRSNEFGSEQIETIYFGGGTPSILPTQDLALIFEDISTLFPVSSQAEVTLEANPDDITTSKLKEWQSLGINRLSIGIQSFHQEDLAWMNRAHNSSEAHQCVQLAQEIGITDISIDLIYGLPHATMEQWENNLQLAVELSVPHISAYGLTIEPNTHFGYQQSQGTLKELPDEQANTQFQFLMEFLSNHGYEHYEISNFAKPDKYSRHNTAYWQGKNYLGIGPSAHSFNGTDRSWNVANNRKYITKLQQDQLPSTIEVLSANDQYNDFVLTQLRTQWGINPSAIQTQFGPMFSAHFGHEIASVLKQDWVHLVNGSYVLTANGKLLADHVCMRLFKTD